MTTRNRRGFSLVEVLVVLLIIAVLLGVLVPALARARATARRAACAGNLRTLHQAVEQYRAGFDELFPYADGATDLATRRYAPFDALAPWVDAPMPTLRDDGTVLSQAPFRCPGDRVPDPAVGFSVMYRPWDLFRAWPALETQRQVSLLLANTPKEWLFVDLDAWHPGPSAQGIRVEGSLGSWK